MDACLLRRRAKDLILAAALCVASAFLASGCGKFGYDPAALEDDDANDEPDGGRGPRLWDGGAWGREPGTCNGVPNTRLEVCPVGPAAPPRPVNTSRFTR
jgi:hypothetical protein